MKRVLCAMSGGVDSAAAALLLLERGYAVTGATMLLRPGGEAEAGDAKRVCDALGLEFLLLDLREEFERLVIEPFRAVYQAGGTPNPCVVCNRTLKFGLLLDRALELGFDAVATGHYARIEEQAGQFLLKTAAEAARDQSYFLYTLTQAQLSRILFPLGGLTKAEARALCAQAQLPVAAKRDSQDICFVPDGDYMAFLRSRGMEPTRGSFLLDGRAVASHAGMEAYTIGQRRGLEFSAGRRVYVTGKRGGDVLLGEDADLFTSAVTLTDVNWITQPPAQAECKLRSGPRRGRCTVQATDTGAVLHFAQPQRAVTPGQSAVLYDNDTVLGGGVIAPQNEEKRNFHV